MQVSINVTDVNDNAPKFLNLQPDVNLMENPLSCGTYNTTVCNCFTFTDSELCGGRFLYGLYPTDRKTVIYIFNQGILDKETGYIFCQLFVKRSLSFRLSLSNQRTARAIESTPKAVMTVGYEETRRVA